MSKANAEKFIDALVASKDLRDKVNQAAAQIVQLAKNNGYEVTAEEVAAALRAHWFMAAAEEGHVDPLNHVFSETPGL
jgi:predicted ribosomally synthesized peptide with nif11-like leader